VQTAAIAGGHSGADGGGGGQAGDGMKNMRG